jgi:hypothetical protein
MPDWWSFGGGAVVGALSAWFFQDFAKGPFNKFRDLRGRVIRERARFGNVRARWRENREDPNSPIEVIPFSADDAKRLAEAQQTFRDLASEMRSFAQNETVAVWIVRLLLRCDPSKASAGLFGMSNSVDTSGANRAFQKRTVDEALRIRDD